MRIWVGARVAREANEFKGGDPLRGGGSGALSALRAAEFAFDGAIHGSIELVRRKPVELPLAGEPPQLLARQAFGFTSQFQHRIDPALEGQVGPKHSKFLELSLHARKDGGRAATEG